MEYAAWFLLIGALLIFMALVGTWVERLPTSTAAIYLLIGIALGPAGLDFMRPDPLADVHFWRVVSEVALIIALFSAGLKLRSPFSDRRWRVAARLAFPTMGLTVALLVLVSVFLLGFTLAIALVVAAILAPTDAALAAEVQVENAGDRDEVRFSLTGEAGMNDGSALPFLLLGLGMLGAHDLGQYGWRWWAVDLLWGTVGGLGVGWLIGILVGHLVLYLRREHLEALGRDEFIAIGLLALSYGVALLTSASGFLAVFAAGVALRHIERRASGTVAADGLLQESNLVVDTQVAADPKRGAAYMTHAVLGFNEQLERVAEVGLVLVIGGMLSAGYWSPEALYMVPLLFFVIRPLCVFAGLCGAGVTRMPRYLLGWFGIRGVGSLWYLLVAVEHGLPHGVELRLVSLILTIIAVSIVLHGLSATPLMTLYRRRKGADT